MISSVQWQWILLGAGPGDGGQSHRVARRRAAGGSDLVYNSGTDSPMQDSWVSSPSAPPTITYGGQEYVRAFWSVTAHDSMSSQGSAQIQPGTGTANDSHFGGSWTVAAKLYYIAWGGGSGVGGEGAVLIDAFDIQAGDFFPDDFVDVTPDPGHTLTPAANDGYIDTTTQIQEGTALTIAARDGIPGKDSATGGPSIRCCRAAIRRPRPRSARLIATTSWLTTTMLSWHSRSTTRSRAEGGSRRMFGSTTPGGGLRRTAGWYRQGRRIPSEFSSRPSHK